MTFANRTRWSLAEWEAMTGEEAPPGVRRARLGTPSRQPGFQLSIWKSILVVHEESSGFFYDHERYVIDTAYEPADVAYVERRRIATRQVELHGERWVLLATTPVWAFYARMPIAKLVFESRSYSVHANP